MTSRNPRAASLIDSALEKLRALRTEAHGRWMAHEQEARIEMGRIEGLDCAIRSLAGHAGDEAPKPAQPRQPPGAVERAILGVLGTQNRPISPETITGLTGHKPASVAAALRRMVQTGAVDKVGEMYRMHRAEQGEAA